MLDNIKDYLAQFSFLDDPEKRRNLLILIVCVVIMFIPLHLGHKWNKLAQENVIAVKQNQAQMKKLDKYADQHIKVAKVRLNNQSQLQKKIETNVNNFADAQTVLNDYQQKNTKISTDERDKAIDIVKNSISSTDILPNPEHYSILYPGGFTGGLSIAISYSPSFSVYSKTITVVFHYNAGKLPIYIVDATYDLSSNKFVDFVVNQTGYTYRYSLKLPTEKKTIEMLKKRGEVAHGESLKRIKKHDIGSKKSDNKNKKTNSKSKKAQKNAKSSKKEVKKETNKKSTNKKKEGKK